MKNRAAVKTKPVQTPDASTDGTEGAVPAKRAHTLPLPPTQPTPLFAEGGEQQEVEVDGRRIVFTAKDEIVLRCGKSSITLTRAGKIIISGEYVVSRSSGVNRIRGGSVQIN